MTDARQQRRKWIDEDRDELIQLLSGFVQAKSPNPPGDTAAVRTHVLSAYDYPSRAETAAKE